MNRKYVNILNISFLIKYFQYKNESLNIYSLYILA